MGPLADKELEIPGRIRTWQRLRFEMLNPIRWISDVVDFLQFSFAASKKDKSGKKSGFLYTAGDPL